MDVSFPITSIFVALFVLMSVPMAIAVGLRRAKTGILILHGDDRDLLKRIRAHGNFVEYVPLALVALVTAELCDVPDWLLIGCGSVLLVARMVHYASLRGSGEGLPRLLGAGLTNATMLVLGVIVLARATGAM